MITSVNELDLDTFRRYAGLSLPRHVSYPMPTFWENLSADSVEAMYKERLLDRRTRDLSLYIHVPFCERLCRFCACTRIVLPRTSRSAVGRVETYVDALLVEIARLAERAEPHRQLRQIHWGGGSPLYLSDEQIESIHARVFEHFQIAGDAEIAMEIDPRNAGADRLRLLRTLGFNRVSLGVQDFDARVQEHVRRVQPFELVRDTVQACHALGFDSINFDLIYGLPWQTAETVRETIEKTIELSPDRIAFYHYAQIPEKIASQRGMDYSRLPDSEAKLEMFLLGISLFQDAGYEFVGLDHLAKPDEGLVKAREDGTLQRNFQGMTTGGGLDLLGAGASAISHLQGIGFLQNFREVDEYVERLRTNGLPVQRGKGFSEDDVIRQAVLNDLYGLGEVAPARIAERFCIDFDAYFTRELETLKELETAGLVVFDDDGVIRLPYPLGRVLLRNVAAVFDAYLAPDAYRAGEQSCFSANA